MDKIALRGTACQEELAGNLSTLVPYILKESSGQRI